MLSSDQSQNQQKPNQYQISDLIMNLQQKQRPLKQSIQKCDVLFSKQKLDSYTRKICKQEVEKQAKNFEDFLSAFRKLDTRTQKPYQNTVRKYKLKVDRHRTMSEKITEDTSMHKIYIEEKKEIWEEEFQRESRIIFYGRGIMGVLGAFMLHLLIGAIYRWAMINGYITSYFKITNDPYLVTSEDSIGGPISMLAVGMTMKPALRFSEKVGKIPLILFAVICMAISILICSWVPTFPAFIFFHNFAYGIFAGILFLTTMSQCQKYFIQWRLYITSAILVGTGLGGVLFGVINTKCMNPEDLMAPSSGYYSGNYDFVAYRLPMCFRNMALYVLLIGLMGWALVTPLLRYNSKQVVIEHRIKIMKDFEFICKDEDEALKSGIFWKIALIVVLSSGGNYFMTMNFKNIPSQTIHNIHFLRIVVLCGSVSNGLFRFVWGFTLQKMGFKWTFLTAMSLNIIAFASIPFAINYYYAYLVVYSISGIVVGGLMVLIPNLCLMVFGDLVGNEIFGYIWFFFTSANFIQYLIGLFLGSHIAHSLLILIFAGTSTLSLVIGSLTTYQGRWDNSLDKLTF